MKYCAKCGNELDDNAVVCMKCGCATEEQNKKQIKKVKRQRECDVPIEELCPLKYYIVNWVILMLNMMFSILAFILPLSFILHPLVNVEAKSSIIVEILVFMILSIALTVLFTYMIKKIESKKWKYVMIYSLTYPIYSKRMQVSSIVLSVLSAIGFIIALFI